MHPSSFIHDRFHGYRTWRGSFFLVVGSCVSSSCAGTTTALVLKLMAVAFSGARFPLPTLCLFVRKSFALALFAGFPRFIWTSIEQELGCSVQILFKAHYYHVVFEHAAMRKTAQLRFQAPPTRSCEIEPSIQDMLVKPSMSFCQQITAINLQIKSLFRCIYIYTHNETSH